jgi:hydrogenase maturation protein HypF
VSALARRERRRVRARIGGTVQGVGFRPYVYRLASELGLDGYVLNDPDGVVVEIEADPGAVDRFFERLAPEAPPLASVEQVALEGLEPTGEHGFAIRKSPRAGEPRAAVTADSATCEDCLRELFDPADRRYRYPFTNCTNCGPRFTIVRGIPYDRPFTTMADFEMCPACRAEYDDPLDRRFHAQPNACPVCGPSLRLVGGGADASDALRVVARALLDGAIVAVKGIGGFHLACRADDDAAVAALRARKHREDKPFALMVESLAEARGLVDATAEDEALLVARERPIVLAPRRPGARVAAAVAPGSRELGVMLPYSPLHHLLLADVRAPLVMTSGNVSDEPIAYRDEDALARLGGIADLFLLHDRPIQTRTDDSVVRTVARGDERNPILVRRSRGYVPASLALPVRAGRPLLACGAELKNTFCVVKGDRAWVSHHIGDLENWETLSSFTQGIDHFQTLFAVEPEVVAHDLHPEYLSTKYALERDGIELIGVQHHHAHLAACLAEHGEEGPALGAIYDGTGYGEDGTVWGGELLYGDLTQYERLGHLLPVRMPGGQSAIREPWRMAAAWLTVARSRDPRSTTAEPDLATAPDPPAPLAGAVSPGHWRALSQVIRSGVASPVTSSIGRLFDAVSALCGICTHVNYEGQAAVELESACDPDERGSYPLPLVQLERRGILDARPTVRAVCDDVAAGVPVGVVATRFHNGLADATARACAVLARRRRCRTIVLAGGTFQNRRLLERVAATLDAQRLRVLIPERLPPGDGGISYGQAAVAAARMASGSDGESRGAATGTPDRISRRGDVRTR